MPDKPQEKIPTSNQVANWLEHDRKLLTEGHAFISEAGHFLVNEAQYESARDEMNRNPHELPTSETEAVSPESSMSPERLSEILDQSLYSVGLRLERGWTVLGHRINASERNSHPPTRGETTVFGRLSKCYSTSDSKLLDPVKPNDPDVTEAVSLLDPEAMGGSKPGWSVIEYKTLVGNSKTYKFAPGGDSRPGQYIKAHLFMKTENAHELWDAMQADPKLVRTMVDEMVISPDKVDVFQNGSQAILLNPKLRYDHKKWMEKGYRPPYRDWQAVTGTSKIGFYNRQQGAHDERIAEFIDPDAQAPHTAELHVANPVAELSPEEEKARTLEVLSSDPNVYHAVDWWSGSRGGHGIHFRTGNPPSPQLAESIGVASKHFQKIIIDSGLFGGSYWHRGRGIVFKIESDAYNAYVLNYQVPEGSRPDVWLCTAFPKHPEYDNVVSGVEKNPELMLELMNKISPDELKGSTNGIWLATKELISVPD